MKNSFTQIKDYPEALNQNTNSFLSRLVTVSVLVFGNLIVCLLLILIYLLFK